MKGFKIPSPGTFYWKVLGAKGDDSYESLARRALVHYIENRRAYVMSSEPTFFSFYNSVRGHTKRKDVRHVIADVLGFTLSEDRPLRRVV